MIDVHIDGIIFGLQKQGGISRVFANMLGCLGRRLDTKVTLYIPREAILPPGLPDSIRIVDYPVVLSLKPRRYFGRMNEMRRLKALDDMWARVERGVFHSTFYSTYRTLSIPQIFTLQDMIYELFPDCFPSEKGRRHMDEKTACAEAAAAIVCPSESAMNDAGRFYDLKSKRASVIPYAVESLFKPDVSPGHISAFRTKYTSGSPFVLFVGARMAHKNFIGFLAAFRTWRQRKKIRLLAVGGGVPSEDELSIVRCFGMERDIFFCPYIDERGLVLAYNSADALIVPALYEGFGFPVLEAMACGTPVASSNGGSLPEVGGVTPVYFDPQDGDSIVGALDEVVQISRESARIKEGVLRASQRTWEQVVEEYCSVYRAVVG